jgi:hypothetical protein
LDKNDIVGKRFGKLHVDSFAGYFHYGRRKKRQSFYRCTCDCGNQILVSRELLLRGRKVRCGHCYRIISEGDHMRYITANGNSFIFDKADLPLVENRNWYTEHGGYPESTIDGQVVWLSRILLKAPPEYYVDHINGDPSDNRRQNLRLATELDNQRNMCLPKHNTSGFKGVSFRKDRGKFRAYISLHNKTKHLGTFENAEDAARAYDKAARFYFGSFACLNFPNPGEQSCFRNR